MKKDAIRAEVNAVLKTLGFTPKQYRWMGPELHVVVGGEFRTFRFAAGRAKREIWRDIGRMEGFIEAHNGPIVETAPRVAVKPNGAAHALG